MNEKQLGALLLPDGSAFFVSPNGAHLPKLEELGWSGLHGFLSLHPEASVRLEGGVVLPEALSQLKSRLRKTVKHLPGTSCTREPEWPERIAAALKPGRKYARHYTTNDLAAAFPGVSKDTLRTYIDRTKKAGLIVAEPWGPVKITYRRAGSQVDETTRALVESWNYSTYHNSWCNKNMLNLTVTDAERELGLTPTTLHTWLINHDLHVILRKRGKYRYVFPAIINHYLEQTERENVPRVLSRPGGYVSLNRAVDIVESDDSVIWRAVGRGDVRAVRKGLAHYYCRADLERLAWSLKNTPLPGYEGIKRRCKALGADSYTCVDWLRRHGYEVRQFRASDKQIANYALTRDLDTWAEGYLADRRHRLDMNQARDIRRQKAEGVPALARAYGVDNNTVRQILLGNTYRETELEEVAA